MEFDFCDGNEDGKHNGINLLEISKIFAVQDLFFFGTGLIDRV